MSIERERQKLLAPDRKRFVAPGIPGNPPGIHQGSPLIVWVSPMIPWGSPVIPRGPLGYRGNHTWILYRNATV